MVVSHESKLIRIYFVSIRVGRSITPPNALMGPTLNSSMPTAAAVAAAAATAKIQAMDAVATNAVLGKTKSPIMYFHHLI